MKILIELYDEYLLTKETKPIVGYESCIVPQPGDFLEIFEHKYRVVKRTFCETEYKIPKVKIFCKVENE